MKTAPKMPEEYKGKIMPRHGGQLTNPREYTPQEIEWIKKLRSEGFTGREVAESVGRTHDAIKIKLKRLEKKNNSYNRSHYQEKYETNKKFLEAIKPKTVLDLYCGEANFYKDYETTTNDLDPSIPADHHEEALKLLCRLYSGGVKFDLIDLDPFGSAYDCLDLAIKMANKGIAITLGELGHVRWKRLDYVRYRYNITRMEDFTIEHLVEEIQKIGLRNHKRLSVVFLKEWKNTGRVYFQIKKIKITEQWRKEE